VIGWNYFEYFRNWAIVLSIGLETAIAKTLLDSGIEPMPTGSNKVELLLNPTSEMLTRSPGLRVKNRASLSCALPIKRI
jgi:hypothetical protein